MALAMVMHGIAKKCLGVAQIWKSRAMPRIDLSGFGWAMSSLVVQLMCTAVSSPAKEQQGPARSCYGAVEHFIDRNGAVKVE